jgi:hypothetical protein
MTRRQNELLKMYGCMVLMAAYALIFVEWAKAPLLLFVRDFPPFWSKLVFLTPALGPQLLLYFAALKFWRRSEDAAEVERKVKIGVRVSPGERK